MSEAAGITSKTCGCSCGGFSCKRGCECVGCDTHEARKVWGLFLLAQVTGGTVVPLLQGIYTSREAANEGRKGYTAANMSVEEWVVG